MNPITTTGAAALALILAGCNTPQQSERLATTNVRLVLDEAPA